MRGKGACPHRPHPLSISLSNRSLVNSIPPLKLGMGFLPSQSQGIICVSLYKLEFYPRVPVWLTPCLRATPDVWLRPTQLTLARARALVCSCMSATNVKGGLPTILTSSSRSTKRGFLRFAGVT